MNKKRIPRQNRSTETKKKILSAGLVLFSKKGLQGTSSREIASEAGVSIGSFYSYFDDKRDLFIELLRMHRIKVMNIISDYSLKEITDENRFELIKQFIKNIRDSHISTYELDQKADVLRNTDPEIDSILKEQEEASLNQTIMLLNSIKNRLRIKNIEIGAILVSSMIRETFHSHANFKKGETDMLIDELADMVNRYLFE